MSILQNCGHRQHLIVDYEIAQRDDDCGRVWRSHNVVMMTVAAIGRSHNVTLLRRPPYHLTILRLIGDSWQIGDIWTMRFFTSERIQKFWTRRESNVGYRGRLGDQSLICTFLFQREACSPESEVWTDIRSFHIH